MKIAKKTIKSLALVYALITIPIFSFSDNSSLENQEWLRGTASLSKNYTWYDAVNFINNDPRAIKSWASNTNEETYCKLIYKAKWGRIWSMGLFYSLNILYTRDVIIPNFEQNDYVLIPFWGEAQSLKGIIHLLLKNAKYPENFFFLANSEEDALMLNEEPGVQAYAVSHNAFIDRNAFYPAEVPKTYDSVYVGCCRPQKRLYLAKEVLPNMLVVTHSDSETSKVVSGAKKIIYNPPIELFPSYICQASCGLLLSASEGGCYSSTEYLYCGIPVVSTKSIGGRDAYYNSTTAIVVDDNPFEIAKAVSELKSRQSDPWKIREEALKVSDKMLDELAYSILYPIFLKYNDRNQLQPRRFVDRAINKSKQKSTKGRTVFQPENGQYNTVEKIIKEQIHTHPNKMKILKELHKRN